MKSAFVSTANVYNLFGAYMPGSQEYHVGVDIGIESNKGLKVKNPDDSIHLHFEVRKGNVAKKGKENGGTNNTTGNAPLIETQWGVHPIMDNLMPYSYMLIHKNC